MEDELLKSCIQYFKNNKGFVRILNEMRSKWKKYGKISGNIKINNPSEDEIRAISGFMGKIFFDDIKFSMSDFEKALSETKYKDVKLKDIIEGYFSEKLITNKEANKIKTEKRENFFNEIIVVLTNSFSKNCVSLKWFDDVVKNKKYGYSIIISEYEKSSSDIKKIIFNVCSAAEYLENDKTGIRLAVLAALITSDPHYFDRKNIAGKLLIHILDYINNTESQSAENILILYYMSGIMPDDISSFTVLYGISLYNKFGLHKAYENFINYNESYVVTLSNINNIVKADCKRKIVFVFENQMVFSHICGEFKNEFVSLICTSGQMKTASLIVIDLLCKSECILYYSGDIDPDGILIADKILLRHPNNIKPWRMSKEDYCLSVSDKEIPDRDIKKLDNVCSKELAEVCDIVRANKKAAYQEMLMDYMINDIRESLKNTLAER